MMINKTRPLWGKVLILAFGLVSISASTAQGDVIMGADISLTTFMEQRGKVFRDNGVAKPLPQLLYDRGANLFRLRQFVNPNTNYSATNGAIQDQNYNIALAQQIKSQAPNAKILLDLHYSDSWADPGRQTPPAAWAGQTNAQMQTTLRNYTRDTINAFRAAGVAPDMVQVGNEINSGMLWDNGRINFSGTTAQQQASWQNFGGLVDSAIQGVRDAQGTGPKIDVALHVGNGAFIAPFFFSRLTDPTYGNVSAASFDIMGVSYYPTASNSLTRLTADLTSIVNTFNKKTMIMETNAPWTSTFAPASDPNYPDTPEGQLQYLLDLRRMMENLPNNNGLGIVYWAPEAVLVNGFFVYNGGSTALFDNIGNALPAMGAFTAVPEPSSFFLVISGSAVMFTFSRRRASGDRS